MNYKKHYDLLINRAINRTINGYTENHHIIPRCIGGTDEKTNLVKLTPEEHYIAHQLLVKIYPKENGLKCALVFFKGGNNGMIRNNHLYGWVRRKAREGMVILATGRTHTEETKEKLRQYKGENHHNFGKKREEGHSEKVSDGLKIYWSKVKSGEIIRAPREKKKTGKPAWNSGITGVFHHTEETKKRISIKMKNLERWTCP